MHEWAAKIDEYARGMVGPTGSTLFEELGLYYIGPVDGHNIEDLICVLREVASLDSMGPVLVHVITKDRVVEYVPKIRILEEHERGSLFFFFFSVSVTPLCSLTFKQGQKRNFKYSSRGVSEY